MTEIKKYIRKILRKRFLYISLLFIPLALLLHSGYGLAYWVYSSPGPNHYPFTSDFENNSLEEWSWFGAKQLCCTHSAEIVEDPVRTGKFALRMSLQRGDPHVKNSVRAELRMKAARFGLDYWYAFSVFVPPNWEPMADKVTFAQWHSVPDRLLGEGSRPPPLGLEIVQNEFQLRATWDAGFLSSSWFHEGSAISKKTLWSGPLETGSWIDWRVRVRWSHDDDGVLELWQNDRLVFQRTGPNAFNDFLAPYFKIGVYISDWKSEAPNSADATKTRTLIFDSIRVTERGVDIFPDKD